MVSLCGHKDALCLDSNGHNMPALLLTLLVQPFLTVFTDSATRRMAAPRALTALCAAAL